MDDASRRRQPERLGAVRQATALVLTACLLVACSTPETADREQVADRTRTESPTRTADPDRDPDRTLSPSPQPRASREPSEEPTTPATRNAGALADQLDRAAATLREPDATAAEVQRAGEFQQLAVRALAAASPTFRRRVTASLRPRTAVVVRNDVEAAMSLQAMTGRPQRRLPSWRIVEPPPPSELLGYYARAQRRTGVLWTYLAAIHLVETRMGRIRGTSTAGAKGPMQFLPTTWELYGAGGDIHDPRDAILAAARLLKAHGAPRDMARALWHYNPSNNYVRAVSRHARAMQRSSSAYRGYWHWRVLYRHARGTYVLPVGYPRVRPMLLSERG